MKTYTFIDNLLNFGDLIDLLWNLPILNGFGRPIAGLLLLFLLYLLVSTVYLNWNLIPTYLMNRRKIRRYKLWQKTLPLNDPRRYAPAPEIEFEHQWVDDFTSPLVKKLKLDE